MGRRRDPDNRWSVVAAIGAAASVLGITALVGRRKTSTPAPTPPARVALIGDSYAVGLGPELAKQFNNFKYEGHVGISTAGWMNCATCAPWLPDFKPDLVLVSLGANDGTSPNLADYQAIVRALHGIGARVEWIMPPAGLANRAAVRDVIAALGVPVVPATQTPLGPDGVHPVSYAPWAAEVARAVSSGAAVS